MVKVNKLLMISLFSIALVALCGVASAAYTVHVDKVQVNGNYIGIPTLIPGDTFSKYGYTYTFNPDGTYTVMGTITNDGTSPVTVRVGGGNLMVPLDIKYIEVPGKGTNNGKAGFSVTFPAAGNNDVAAGYGDPGWIMLDLSKIDFVNAPDTMTHTVDQGPMSDATAIFSNGKLTYKGPLIYTVS